MTNGLVKEGLFKAVPSSVSLGKEIRTASKNSVANYYSHCLDSPLYSASQALSLEAGLTPADSGPGTEGRAATMAGAPGVETMGDRVDSG